MHKSFRWQWDQQMLLAGNGDYREIQVSSRHNHTLCAAIFIMNGNGSCYLGPTGQIILSKMMTRTMNAASNVPPMSGQRCSQQWSASISNRQHDSGKVISIAKTLSSCIEVMTIVILFAMEDHYLILVCWRQTIKTKPWIGSRRRKTYSLLNNCKRLQINIDIKIILIIILMLTVWLIGKLFKYKQLKYNIF